MFLQMMFQNSGKHISQRACRILWNIPLYDAYLFFFESRSHSVVSTKVRKFLFESFEYNFSDVDR